MKKFFKRLIPVVAVSLIVACAVGCAKKADKESEKTDSQENGDETNAADESKFVDEDKLKPTKSSNDETSKAPAQTKEEDTSEEEDEEPGISETEATIEGTFTESFKNANQNNPIVSQRYGADPGVMVYGDTVYIYCTNDEFEYKDGKVVENTYGKIKTINCFSSKDLVNWTDHGAMEIAGVDGAAKWAACSWAPCAVHKTIDGKEKFFLYFANNGSGIGVVCSDSPTGPWVDPVGGPLITQMTENCGGVVWCFDPAVLVDEDGCGYLYFGGGLPANEVANPKTSRVVKLSDDMISLAGTPEVIDAPYIFEDSCINRIGDKYYYSYCSNWNASGTIYSNCAIEYMVSDSPMGPFTYAGELFRNPGVYFGVWGNNHHTLFEFNGKYYLAYHARALETAQLGESLGYRSTQLDEVVVEDGVLKEVKATMKGVNQLCSLNPYEKVMATTMANQAGIAIAGVGNTVVTDINDGDWTSLKGVDFAEGAKKIVVNVKSEGNGSVEIYANSLKGEIVGIIDVDATNGEFATFETEVSDLEGVKDIYFVFRGNMEFVSWEAVK